MSARLTTLLLVLAPALAAADEPAKPFPYRTFFVTRSLTHEKLLPYLEAAKPELVQIGNYGAMFHGYADNPKSTGWPMQLPVAGEKQALAFQRKLNQQVHDLGLKVIGHFRLIKVMGDWEEQTGFVTYYNQRYPEDLLGKKPHPQVTELLARNAQGVPLQQGRYNQAQLALCLSSPHARTMLKEMLRVAIENGVDGVDTNFNYTFGCECQYCQAAFKAWLKQQYSPQQIEARLGVKDLAGHTFSPLPARIPGYPDVETATELDWLASRWGAEHFKRMFDEIFIDYGRQLKPDLMLAQWNHLSHVSLKEERAFTPLELWGRGEDFFWYSGGAAFVDKNHDLTQGKAGDAWLSALYIRELSGGKPFVIGKYDRTRLAASMAEGCATGGLGMGRYMRFEEPVGFEVLARYTNFMHQHRQLYEGAQIHADAALVLPRQSVLNRRPDALDGFRSLGQGLVEKQVLLDVLLDQKISLERLQQYRTVVLAQAVSLSQQQRTALKQYVAGGGHLLTYGEIGTLDEQGQPTEPAQFPGVVPLSSDSLPAADLIHSGLLAAGCSAIHAPWTVRVAAYRQPGRTLLHLVNYDRQPDAPTNNRTGPETELPKAVEDVEILLLLPDGTQVTSVTLHAPDREESLELPFAKQPGHVRITIPRLLVYGVCEIATKSK